MNTPTATPGTPPETSPATSPSKDQAPDGAEDRTAHRAARGTDDQLRLPAGRRPVPTRTRLSGRRIPVAAYAAVGLLLLGGMVGGSMAMDWWQTDCGGVNEATVASGTLTPDEVKGSMTVQQVVTGFPTLSTAEVLAAFGAPADTPSSTQLKTLVQDGATMDVSDFRLWLEQRLAR